mmetsp:Transcript_16285/g.25204  ORF Transcript_16285/g.25204 Transcript_16285/m.25204 type:complete len:102 (+) Transcript_16285:413-718(+)
MLHNGNIGYSLAFLVNVLSSTTTRSCVSGDAKNEEITKLLTPGTLLVSLEEWQRDSGLHFPIHLNTNVMSQLPHSENQTKSFKATLIESRVIIDQQNDCVA